MLEALAPSDRPLPRLRSPGGGEDPTFGITVKKDETLTRRPAVGRTVVRGQSRHRRLPARRNRQTAARRPEPRRQHRQQRRRSRRTRRRSRSSAGKTLGPSPEVQLAIDRCFSKTQKEVQLTTNVRLQSGADPAAKPRIKLILLQNGGGVTATEYPESTRRRRRRPDDLRARRAPPAAISVGAIRPASPALPSPTPRAARSPTTSARSAARRRRRPLDADDPQADVGRHRLRPDDLLRAHQNPGDLPLLRHLRRRRRTPPRSPPWRGRRTRSLTPAQIGAGAGGHGEAGGRLRPRRGRRRPARRPQDDRRRRPAAGDHDRQPAAPDQQQPLAEHRLHGQPPGLLRLLDRRRGAAPLHLALHAATNRSRTGSTASPCAAKTSPAGSGSAGPSPSPSTPSARAPSSAESRAGRCAPAPARRRRSSASPPTSRARPSPAGSTAAWSASARNASSGASGPAATSCGRWRSTPPATSTGPRRPSASRSSGSGAAQRR